MAESTVKIVFLGDASKLKRELDDIDGKVDKSGGAFDRFGKQSVPGVAAIGVAAGAAFVHFGTMGNALEAMGKKAETVFEGSKGEIDQWADANAKAMGLTDDQLTGLAANFGDLLKPMGFTADQAADMSKDVVGLSGALSAWSGGTTSSAEASDILAKAMLGERDGLKSLGISISEADVQARLAKNGTEKLTGAALEQAKAVATQELIFEKSTDAQKAWSDGSMDAIKSQNSIKSSMGELQEQIANRLQPAFAALTGWLVDTAIPAFDQFSGWVRDNWPQIQEVIENVMARVRAVIETVLGAIEAFWRTWGGTITAYLQGLWEGIRQVIEGALRVVQGVINVVMGLIHGDFSRVWDGIRQIFSGVWEAINGLVDLAINEVRTRIEIVMRLIAGVFDTAWEGIKSATSAAIDALVEFVQALPNRILAALAGLATLLVGLGLDLINGLGTGIRNAWEALIAFVESIPGMVLGVFRDAGSWLLQIGKDIIQGLWNGVKEIWDRMTGWIADAADKLPGFLKRALGINSPSRVMREVGQFTMLGLHEGMKDGWSPIPGWLEDIGDSMADRASEMSDAMSWAVEDMGTAMVGSMSSTMDTMVDVVAAGAKRAVDAWYPAIIAIDEQYRNNEPLYDPDPEGVLERANEERRRQMNDSRAAAAAAAPAGDLTLNFNAPVSRSDATYISDTVQRTLMSNQMRVALAGA